MKLKRVIIYSWWYLFYSAYWTAYYLGEKHTPESNANYLLNILILLNIFGIMQLFAFFGYKVSIPTLLIICILPAYSIPYLSFQKKDRYKIRMKEFKFLRNVNSAKKRHLLLIFLSIWTISFVAISNIINIK